MTEGWQADEATVRFIHHLSLQNALQYEGKAAVGSVISRIMGSCADLRQHGQAVAGLVAQHVAQANAMAKEEGLEAIRDLLASEAPDLLATKAKQAKREGLPPLEGAQDGNVVLRFAPNPNGPLSFGHARGLVINAAYRAMYNGTLILRFDDTDTKVKPPMLEAYEQIEKEATWLMGRAPERIVIASDRMDVYHQHAVRLLTEGHGYVCTCPAEVFKTHRVGQTNCPCRDNSIDANLEGWRLMNDGTHQPGDAVVRVRTDMTLKNPALRDWPALRIQDTTAHPHPRPEVGSKHRVWPLLDFQSAVEDHLQGVTHIIRGKDLMDSTRKQTLLYEHFGWTYPETLYWGRVKVHEWGGFSTSAMRNDIESGHYSGWDDPRLPTLAGLSARGISAEALRGFWTELGITQKDIAVPLSTLYAHNTKAIDDGAPRLTLVRQPVRLDLSGHNAQQVVRVPVHPNHEGMGHRSWSLANNGVLLEPDDVAKGSVRLKEFADVVVSDGVASVQGLERSDRRPIVHWLPEGQGNLATLVETSEGQMLTTAGVVEVHDHQVGTIVQLERIGYAVVMANGSFMLCHETTSDAA